MAERPFGIEMHQADYKEGAWEQYSLQELGEWVHLLAKRAEHRDNHQKASKDIHDAKNYLEMMGAKLKEVSDFLGVNWEMV